MMKWVQDNTKLVPLQLMKKTLKEGLEERLLYSMQDFFSSASKCGAQFKILLVAKLNCSWS